MNYDPKSTAILLSLKPEYYPDIFNGDKVLELRKSVPREFGSGWVYIYITKSKPLLYITGSKDALNGKVVGRFWFDKYKYEIVGDFFKPYYLKQLLDKLCISERDFKSYLNGKMGKAWLIKDFEHFATPIELSSFYQRNINTRFKSKPPDEYRLQRPPQSWQYVWIGDELELIKE